MYIYLKKKDIEPASKSPVLFLISPAKTGSALEMLEPFS